MKTNSKWILAAVILVAILIVVPLIFRSGGMMGGWRHPMMGGYSYLPLFGGMMGFGMLFMWAIPLGLLFLLIYGAVRLATQPGPAATAAHVCSNCGKSTQPDWKNCPYCGTEL